MLNNFVELDSILRNKSSLINILLLCLILSKDEGFRMWLDAHNVLGFNDKFIFIFADFSFDIVVNFIDLLVVKVDVCSVGSKDLIVDPSELVRSEKLLR